MIITLVSLGAVSAASDDATVKNSIAQEELNISSSSIDEINTIGDDFASSDNVDENEKLSVNLDDENLAVGTVNPSYKFTPSSGSVIMYGQVMTVTANITNATGNVTFTVNGNNYTGQLVNGIVTKNITNYTLGSNRISVLYSGDDYYKSVSTYFYINARVTNSIVATGCDYGQIAFVNVNLYNATGNVTFTLNGNNKTKKAEGKEFIVEFTEYTLGSNTVSIVYGGDDKYNSFSTTVRFTTTLNVDAPTIYNFEDAIIIFHMGNATGTVNMTMGDDNYTVNLIDGVASINLKNNYTIGSNKLDIAYTGDDTFNPFTSSKTFTVLDKENATIFASVYQTAEKNIIAICIPNGANSNVTVVINGDKKELQLVDGEVTIDILESDVINEINVTYDGNYRLNPANSTLFKKLNNTVNSDNYLYYFNVTV